MDETTIWWVIGALFLGYWLGKYSSATRRSARVIDPAHLTAETLARVEEAIGRGAKIEAIKLLRADTGIGLKDAKAFVDAHAVRTERKGDPIER